MLPHLRTSLAALCALSLGCGSKSGSDTTPVAPKQARHISVIGTNDLHGHLEMLPIFGGYLDILRQKEQAFVLIDGGDMFQGTLASNMQEGLPIVEAYNQLGYHAVAIGNHEFDFGPVGSDTTVQGAGQDPRGALKKLAKAADFPFLGANILEGEVPAPIAWSNVSPTAMTSVAGVRIGIIGISTFDTPRVTLAANFVGLQMAPLADTIDEYAADLRSQGADVVIVAAHAGGKCTDFSDHTDLSSCLPEEEIYQVANQLEPKRVDVIVAGHTHQGMAHEINGIAIIESFARGHAFGRIDLVVDDKGVHLQKIHAPRSLCADAKTHGPGCDPGRYEDKPVVANEEIAKIAAEAAQLTEEIRSQYLGIDLKEPILRSRTEESPLGNLFVDLMLAAQPEAQIAITNGGSLRADLPIGPLNYGSLFEAMPFDNRFARFPMSGEQLREMLKQNLQAEHGILSVAGMRVKAECSNEGLEVMLIRDNGDVIRNDDTVVVATSDFLASGGDGLIAPSSVDIDGGLLIRDAMAEQIKAEPEKFLGRPASLYNPRRPRLHYAGSRPLHCR
jgi:5'-nucleotidase